MKPFKVFCDMTDKGGIGVTVISHDSENRTLVKLVVVIGAMLLMMKPV